MAKKDEAEHVHAWPKTLDHDQHYTCACGLEVYGMVLIMAQAAEEAEK